MSAKINPIIKYLLTNILLAFVVGVAVYFIIEQKEIEPRYAISNSEMLAETTVDAPRLKLLWDNEEVQNVYSLKIAIWNAGREYLDKNSISATDPIRVMIPPGVRILYADFIRTSRDNLSFTATDLSDTGTSVIQIQIVGDEALEHKDGGVLKILYTGQNSDKFAVTGRIKGSKQGFKEVSWATATQTPNWWGSWVPVLFIALAFISVIRDIKSLRGQKIQPQKAFDIFLTILIIAGLCTYIWSFFRGWLVSLGWIIGPAPP